MRLTLWDHVAIFCSRHNIAFRVVSGVLVFGGGFAAPLAWTVTPWLAAVPIAVAAAAISLREFTGLKHSQFKTEPARKTIMWKMLEFACRAITPATIPSDLPADAKVIRACVLLHENGRLKSYVAYNMNEDYDRTLEFDVSSGVAGHVFLQQEGPYTFDLASNPDHPLARLTPNHVQAAVRRNIKCILAVPIYDPYAGVPIGQRDKMGVLCFDSDLSLDVIGFSDIQAKDVATMVADLLSIPIKER